MPKFEFPFRGETKTLNASSRASLPGQFVELPGGVTHYELGGPSGGKLVVLVHGFSIPFYIWDPTYEALTQVGFRVLRYDLFGRGYSDRPNKRYNVDLFTKQLLDLLDALEMRKPVNLVGLSMGGVIVGDFTSRHTERADKLVFTDPAGFKLDLPLTLKLVMFPLIGEVFFSIFGSQSLLKGMASDFYDPPLVEQFIDRYRSQMEYKGFKRALLSSKRNGMLGDALETYKQIGRQDRRVLLFWGREDKTVPFENSALMLEAIPQTEFHPIDKIGHIPHYEAPEVVNPILIKFLEN
ncbi:MAG: alpha/beta hydrolase [Chloroflexi bacterium]|nr:alpha/beta hydrolase [Chloroflexota bacterium]